MINLAAVPFEPDAVLDVGGNVGEFAELARRTWPGALLTSFEPVPELARVNRARADGRWLVEEVAISGTRGCFPIHVCLNQPTASTMHTAGPLRRERFGIRDRWKDVMVPARRLDEYLASAVRGRTLVKVDVEGHEGEVIVGARDVLLEAAGVIVEVQQSPEIFEGSWSPAAVNLALEAHGLEFAGVVDSFADPRGVVVQFDGLWLRV